MIIVELPGAPIGKGRPRVRVVTPKQGPAFAHFYPEPETAAFEKAFKMLARAVMRSRPPLEGPLIAVVTASVPVPKSWSMKKRDAALAGAIRPTGKPDGDNYLKIACDACNEILYLDDAQLVDKRVIKIYSENPSLRMELIELDPLDALQQKFTAET